MALDPLLAPDDVTELARRALGHLRQGSEACIPGPLVACAGEPLWLALPHPVFELAPDREVLTLDAGRMTAWRYLVMSRNAVVATLEMAVPGNGQQPRLAYMADGPAAASTVRAIGRAERSQALRARRYVLGLLRIPSPQLEAVWLRDGAADGRHDRFWIAGTPHGPRAERLLDAAQLRKAAGASKRAG
jgi:hypothetical protein